MHFFIQKFILCALLSFVPPAYSKTHKTSDYLVASSQKEYDDLLANKAVALCRRVRKKKIKMATHNAHRLLRVERQIGIPDLMYGMTLAAACLESAFNERAEGDHKFSKKRKPLAIGILQLWSWVKQYKVNRMNLESSSMFWLNHIVRQRQKTKRKCRPRSALRSWRQAWVTAVRFPKKGGRCREKPRHWRLFLKLQKFKKKVILKYSPNIRSSDGNQKTN